MLSHQLLRDHTEVVRAGLRRRGDSMASKALDEWLRLDGERRALATRRDHTGLSGLEAHMRARALRLPNIPDARVPEGLTPAQNVELRRWGEIATPPAPARTHEQLAGALGLLDPARATKLAGPRFPLLVGAGARLARALVA